MSKINNKAVTSVKQSIVLYNRIRRKMPHLSESRVKKLVAYLLVSRYK